VGLRAVEGPRLRLEYGVVPEVDCLVSYCKQNVFPNCMRPLNVVLAYLQLFDAGKALGVD
jgi:hypothetical protein